MLEGAFNQEKALVGAFSVIVTTDGSFAALVSTTQHNLCQGFRVHFLDGFNKIG